MFNSLKELTYFCDTSFEAIAWGKMHTRCHLTASGYTRVAWIVKNLETVRRITGSDDKLQAS
jgi:hypothetical protein